MAVTGSFKRQYKPSAFNDIEDIEDYVPGGFHPIHIGDILDHRYEVLHKLGYGGFSTIWLANDVESSQYVASKVIRAEQSQNCTELVILETLESGPSEDPGKNHVASLLTNFHFDGPNGRHLCLVSEVAGPSITAIRSPPRNRRYERILRERLLSRQHKRWTLFILKDSATEVYIELLTNIWY